MKIEDRGYCGKIFHIDLTNRTTWEEPLDENIARLLLGGKGIATYLLMRDTPAGLDPLAPENPLIFFTGPLTGTIAPTAGKVGLVTKGLATRGYLDSYCGGFLGSAIKYAGYDMISVRGRAPAPVSIVVDDGKVEFRSADDLWGMDVEAATKKLKEQVGVDFQTVVIGPGGEHKLPIASIFSDMRNFGRGGSGAVMGAKNLKGMAVRGTGSVKVANREDFEYAAWVAHRALRMSSGVERMKAEGTVNILEFVNVAGALPTRNFQFGHFEKDRELWGERFREKYWVESIACFGCPVACGKRAIVRGGRYNGAQIDGPEYETVFALGSNCCVTDLDALIYANYLCDLYGIDTISVGVIVSFVMELYERGMITSDDLGGIKAEWGSGDALIGLIESIGKGTGMGQLMGQGVAVMAREFPGAERFAMHVKGLELPGYLPNAAKGIGLAFAISERGACHLHGAPLSEVLGGADPKTYTSKAELFKLNQDEVAVIDSAILCYFIKFGMTLKEVWQMIVPATGFDFPAPRHLALVGERISTLCRLYNLREGINGRSDTLPLRCTDEPIPAGPAAGETVQLSKLLVDYYELMGWDEKGVPTRKRLHELGLDNICA